MVFLKFVVLIPALIVALLSLAACLVQESTIVNMTEERALECLAEEGVTVFALTDSSYKERCENRIGKFPAFVVERDGSEDYVMSKDDPEGYSFVKEDHFELEYDAKGGRKFNKGDKVIVHARFDSRSRGGVAQLEAFELTPISITDEERRIRGVEDTNRKLDNLASLGLQVYLKCVDEFLAKLQNSVTCPRPSSYTSARHDPDGTVRIVSGICFFGKSTVLFDCTYKNGWVTVSQKDVI